jgi:Uma2 family endonuclease
MAEPARKKTTVDEFLTWDDGTDRRYELVDGEIVSMAPPNERHSTIAGNLAVAIGRALRRGCRVGVEAGIRLPHRADAHYQADLAVTCAPAGGEPYFPDPVLIVEILSPSTAQRDRGTKLPDYCALSTLLEILLVSSTKREAQLWRRTGTSWIVAPPVAEGTIRLEAIGADIALDDFYAGTGIER